MFDLGVYGGADALSGGHEIDALELGHFGRARVRGADELEKCVARRHLFCKRRGIEGVA